MRQEILFRESRKGYKEGQLVLTDYGGAVRFGSEQWKKYIRKLWEEELNARLTSGEVESGKNKYDAGSSVDY